MKWLADIATVLAIGALSFVLFLFLMPNIEQSLLEFRVDLAYRQVQQIRDAQQKDEPHEELPERDPWGQPYQIIRLGEGVRVLSTGRNETTSAAAPDADDIYSDMPESPSAVTMRAKNAKALRAFLIALGTWIGVSVLYFVERRLGMKSFRLTR
jgi:hypothetical protein